MVRPTLVQRLKSRFRYPAAPIVTNLRRWSRILADMYELGGRLSNERRSEDVLAGTLSKFVVPTIPFKIAVCINMMACPRCHAALSHRFGLDGGYRIGSKEWLSDPNRCSMCNESGPVSSLMSYIEVEEENQGVEIEELFEDANPEEGGIDQDGAGIIDTITNRQ